LFYEAVLVLFLVIIALLVYHVLLFRKLLSRLESLETKMQEMPTAGAAGAESQVLDEEITAVITAAIAAYEEDKR